MERFTSRYKGGFSRGCDDVGRLGSFGDGRMDAVGVANLLSKQGNVVVRSHEGVEGVAAVPWVGAGVGVLASEFAEHLLSCHHADTPNTLLTGPKVAQVVRSAMPEVVCMSAMYPTAAPTSKTGSQSH